MSADIEVKALREAAEAFLSGHPVENGPETYGPLDVAEWLHDRANLIESLTEREG
ncbi:MAG: hypothetical protein KIT69_07375 [Propionibacteriaceae bacterium]|nr:hypothetical protein [Propionibacteriaceae bacterium]